LGILDLERFTRALRLRWLWFKWKQKLRAWNNLEIPCDKVDREFFYASTIVTVEDGKTAPFWSSNWIDGTMPRSIAPLLTTVERRFTECLQHSGKTVLHSGKPSPSATLWERPSGYSSHGKELFPEC
jgi:hypothetical protein